PAGGSMESIIRAAAAAWGADPDQMLRVAYCESHYNPNAVNASSGASGLFQFLPSTWVYQSPRAGYGGASPFDPVANANTAAMMPILADTLADRANARVVQADALAVDLYTLGDRPPTRIVANLPYQITTPLLERFLADARRPPLVVVLVQEEVALRMAAPAM